MELCSKPKEVSNWLMVETMRLLKEHEQDPEEIHFSPKHLAELIKLVDAGTINRTVAKTVFGRFLQMMWIRNSMWKKRA